MMPTQPTDFEALLGLLQAGGVEFIVIGGVAGTALGSPRITFDLDVLYRRAPDNLDRLAKLFAPLSPYPRGAPPNLPFVWDRKGLDLGLNFTLQTSLGFIDLLGEIAGGDYDRLSPHTIEIDVFGVRCRCLDLDTLIRTKRAAGRPKDFEAIAELELVRQHAVDRRGGFGTPGPDRTPG
jgi:hypothetical protein